MNKKIISHLLLSAMLTSEIGFADVPSPEPEEKISIGIITLPPQQLQPGEPDPGRAISPMKKGQKAPFTGVLLSPRAVSEIIVEFESFDEKLHLEITRAINQEQASCDKKVNDLTAKTTAIQKELQANLDASRRETDAFKTELKNVKDSQINPYFLVGAGVAGGIALTLLSTYAIVQITK